MKTIGIVAEYNPFHNGHAYQIAEIKKRTGAEYVAVAMSGDFVQRGAPAIIDKYARAKMAIANGADLVIELPVTWSTASAEQFAMAGVTLFEKMGCVDGLCFGAETDDLQFLASFASILKKEPALYKKALQAGLKEGLPFPTARAWAIKAYCAAASDASFPVDQESIASVLSPPNNILAMEYLKALQRRNSSIQPLLLKREGAAYHDFEVHTGNAVSGASASAIRALLHRLDSVSMELPASLIHVMPESAADILSAYLNDRAAVSPDSLSLALGCQLLSLAASGFDAYGDSNADLSNRLKRNLSHYRSFEQFCAENKSRDVTYTRISRLLIHILLHITKEDYAHGKELDYIPYLRILGFRKNSNALLKTLKSSASVPVISKLADASSLLPDEALFLLEKDIFAANLYEQTAASSVFFHKMTTPRSEYTRKIVIV